MAQSLRLRFGPFLGAHSSLDSRYIQNPYAEFSHDMLHEDGAARPRRGYRRFAAASTFQSQACQAVKMFQYVSAIVADAFYDEYLTVRRHGASGTKCKLFRQNASDGGDFQVIGKAKAVDRIDLDTPTSGNFTLSFNGVPTANIAWNADANVVATNIKNALVALAAIDSADLTVTCVSVLAYRFDVAWDGQYRGVTVPALTINAGTLAHGAGTVACTRTVAASDYQMADSYWDCFEFDQYAYLYNYSAGDELSSPSDAEPFLRYTKGDYASLLAVAPPSAPTDAPSLAYRYSVTGAASYALYGPGAASYALADVTGDGTVIDTGGTSAVVGKQVKVRINTSGRFSITLNLKNAAAAANLYWNDVFNVRLTVNDTTLNTVQLEQIVATLHASGDQQLDVTVADKLYDTAGNLKSVLLYLKFTGKARSSWTAATTLKLEGDVTDSSGVDYLFVSAIEAGGIVDWGKGLHWRLAYTRYDSSTGFESDLSLAKNVDRALLDGKYLLGKPEFPMGTDPLVTVTAGSTDYVRIYAQHDIDGTQKEFSPWRLLVEQLDSDTTWDWGTTYAEFNDIATEFVAGDFAGDNITKARPMFGFVMYGFRDGTIRASAIGRPTALANLDGKNVDIFDPDRGANWTLSDQKDIPVDFWGVGNVAVVLAEKGCHYLGGTKPAVMTFPRRINGAPGCLGRHASCPWRHEGVPGVAYIARDGKSVWFIGVETVADLESGVTAVPLTDIERGEVERHLLQRNPTVDGNVAALNPDLRSDALWFNYSYRAMPLRRPGLVDRLRYWEHYTYGNQSNGSWSGTGWTLFSFDQDRGIKCIAPTGYIDELEYDSSNNMAAIGGEDATPYSTDAAANTVTFDIDPEWPLGLALKPDATAGGLTGGSTYYVRPTEIGTYQFHTSLADAQNNASVVDLTAAVTTTLRPLGRDNGNNLASGSVYWVSPTVNLGFEAAADRADVYRKRMASRPSVKVWARRNPEAAARQLTADKLFVRQWPLTQGPEFQVTLYIEDNSPPVFFLDEWVVPKGRRSA